MAVVQYPEKFFLAVTFVENVFSPLESTPLLDDMQRLTFYALQEQATSGPCTAAAPYFWNGGARAMHGARAALGNMSKFEAMVHYVGFLESLRPSWLDSVPLDQLQLASNVSPSSSPPTSAGVAEPPATTRDGLSPPSAAAPSGGPSRGGNDVGPLDGSDLNAADVSASNVTWLVAEVLRLRRLLAPVVTGTHPRTSTPVKHVDVSVASSCLPEAASSSMVATAGHRLAHPSVFTANASNSCSHVLLAAPPLPAQTIFVNANLVGAASVSPPAPRRTVASAEHGMWWSWLSVAAEGEAVQPPPPSGGGTTV